MDRSYSVLLKCLLLLVALFYAYSSAKNGHDFEVFVYAGGKIIHGQNIYQPPFIQNLQYYYSPLFALILSPLSGLPVIVPQLIWIFISYFLIYRIWILSAEYFDLSAITKKQKVWWIAVAAFFSLRFILMDIRLVQMTIFMLWAILQSMKLIRQQHNIAGSALLAFVINIKLLPLAFVLYLVYRTRYKAAALSCFFYGVYLALPAVYLGWDQNINLLHNWFHLLNPSNKEWAVEAEDGPSSLVALIPVYIIPTTGVLSIKRNFVDLEMSQVILLTNLARLLLVGLTLLFLHSPPFKMIKSEVRLYWEMCYLFLVIPLIYPHQQIYAFMFLTPAFIYLSWYLIMNWPFIKHKVGLFGWIILTIIFINFTPLIGRDIISGKLYELTLFFRFLPIAVILLIPVLWICRPQMKLMEETKNIF